MITQLKCSVKNFTHIVHVGDIHIRLIQRHEEYTDIFDKFYKEVEKTPDTTAIAILGDLFHNKSDLSPECVQSAQDFLCKCSEIRPTVLIAGNHDATLTNKNRLDSLTPIVKALKHKHLFYLRDNGLYALGDILFNNMSIFSDPTEYITYDKIPRKYKNEYVHHIALYHGVVNGVFTDLKFQLFNKMMPVEKFDGHHIVLLGDIHKKQDLQQYDDLKSKPAIHYPGSMIQQNHSETIDGHGFSLWNLTTKTYTHTNILNDYGFFTVEVNQGKLVTDLKDIPKKARIHVKCFESVASEVKAAVATVKEVSAVDEVTYTRVESPDDPTKLKVQSSINLADIADVTYQNKLLEGFLKDKCKITDQTVIDSVLMINTTLNNKIDKDNFARNLRWKPKKFEFDNMFSYGEGNVVDFTKCKDVMGLFGPNASGKTSIAEILCFCLFDKASKTYKASHILNVQKTGFKCKLNFEINNVDYFIEKIGTSDRKGNVKVNVKFWKVENGNEINLSGKDRKDTVDIIRNYVGTYENFILTTLSIQNMKMSSFLDMTQSERKDLISQFIGLVVFDKLLDLASPELKSLTDSIKNYKKDNLEIKLQNSNNEFSSLTSVFNDEQKQLEDLKEYRQTLNNEVLEETKKLRLVECGDINIKKTESSIESKNKELVLLNEKKNKLGVSVLTIQTSIEKLDKTIQSLDNRNVSDLFKQYQKLKSELSHIEQTLELKKVDYTNKKKKKELLDKHEYDPNCKYCVNSIFVKDAKKISGELELDKENIKKLLNERVVLKTQVENLEWAVSSQEEYTISLKKKSELNNKLSSETNDLDLIGNKIYKIEKEIEKLNDDVVLYNRQTETIELNRYVQTSIDQLKQELSNLDYKIDVKTKNMIYANGRLGVLQNQIKQLDESISKIKELEKTYEAYSLYVRAVNRDGLPYIIISNTVPEMEREVNNILEQIVDFRLNVETNDNEINAYINYNDEKWPVELTSGFEKFISSIAIRIALVNLSNLPRPNLMIIDEGWAVIDSNNMPSVQPLLSFLKTNFDFIIVISHLDELRDFSDKNIEISKINGFSHVEYK